MNSIEVKHGTRACGEPGYASPEAAMKAEPEKILYTIALYTRSDIAKPDYRFSLVKFPDIVCTNIAVDRAEWLFNWAEVGTPVVVHY